MSMTSLFRSFRRALVLCAHTDDEFGCAGTIIRLVQAGVDVHYVALSRCEESVPDGLPLDVLEGECRACTAHLGIPPENVHVDDFKVRYMPRDRQPILERFVALNRSLSPDLVLVPSSNDTHQDHAVVCEEGFRAFKHVSMLGYELPQNLTAFENSAFVHLSEEVISEKIRALGLYASQGFRPYASSEFIRGLATVRGVQAKTQYAEAFEVLRLMVS